MENSIVESQRLLLVAVSMDRFVGTLKLLASHDSPEVRMAVCENHHTPLETLMLLAEDGDADVRYSLAENHNIPISVLKKLIEDQNPYVACRAGRTLARVAQQTTTSMPQYSPQAAAC